MYHTTTSANKKHCNACGGTGYQRNMQTGINEMCPICGGKGWFWTEGIIW
jgi:DnaJ-class molecular chaperone